MRFKSVITITTIAAFMLAGWAFAGSLTPQQPPTTNFTFYNDNDFPVKIRASVFLQSKNPSLPAKFLDVEANVAPYGTYTRTEVYEAHYRGVGASGSVWFEGRTLRQDCTCQGVKNVSVRALKPLNVSTNCSGGN